MKNERALPDQPQVTTYFQGTGRGVVLILHGGQERNLEAVRAKHASWWRMALMARALRPFAERNGLALMLLRYRRRGWNDPLDPDPVKDARWALARIAVEQPGQSVILLGHSMGGRTACRVAGDDAVAGVIGLAPWLPAAEPNGAIAGKHLRIIHGTRDRWTSARWSEDFAERSRGTAASVAWSSMPGAGHFMLRRVRAWNRFVEESLSDIQGLTGKRGAPSEGNP